MFEGIDWVGVLVATIAAMPIGAAWFGLLAKPWIAANGFTPEQIAEIEANRDVRPYVVAVATHFVSAAVLSLLIDRTVSGSVPGGIVIGLLCWLGFVATTLSLTHRFQLRPWSLTVLDAGHYLVVLAVQGAILGWFAS